MNEQPTKKENAVRTSLLTRAFGVFALLLLAGAITAPPVVPGGADGQGTAYRLAYAVGGLLDLVVPSAQAVGLACDVDADGDVDRMDINAIMARRNQPAAVPDDPADADGNGVVNAYDARICTLQCTNARCAVVDAVLVPNVVGQSQGAAESAITGAGLVVGSVTTANSDVVPAGNVISQDPAGGTDVAPGSAVDLVVSSGPALILVPDVVGLSQASAEAAIVNAGLSVGTRNFIGSNTVPAGDVISQDPLAGTSVAPGGVVDLDISIGPIVTIESVTADVDPEVLAIDATAAVHCAAIDSTGAEVSPPPAFVISADPAANIVGSDFSSSTDGNFTVTCTLDGDTLSDSVDVIVLPPEVDPLFGDLQNSIETLDELNVAVVAADEAEDVLALQALKDAILAQIGAIDTAALAANPPLPNDADKPLDSQWEDDGDVRDPLVDDPWKAAVLAIRQNIMDFRTLLAGLTPATLTFADVTAIEDFTAELETLIGDLEGLDPSDQAVMDLNDELNDLYTALFPGEAMESGQLVADMITTVPGITAVDAAGDWLYAETLPEDLMRGFRVSSIDSETFHARQAEAFSFVGVMTSTAIANSLRSLAIKTVYKQILNSWKRTAKAISHLAPPVGVDPPTISFVLPNPFPSNSEFQILIAGAGFVPGNTTVNIDRIVSGSSVGVVSFPVAVGSPNEDILANAPALGLACNILTSCAAKVTVSTPGGTSNEIAVTVF